MKKIISILMAIAISCSLALPTFATTSSEESWSNLTMEEAVAYLGITMEDVEGLELLPMPTTQSATASGFEDSSIPYDLPPGVYYEEIPIASFTGALHKIKGPRFQWTYVIGKLDPSDATGHLKISTWIAGRGYNTQATDIVFKQGYTIKGPIFTNTSNLEIFFKYQYSSGQPAMKSGKALMLVQVFGTA